MAKDDVNVSAPRSMTYKLVTVFQIGCSQRGVYGRCQNTGIDLFLCQVAGTWVLVLLFFIINICIYTDNF